NRRTPGRETARHRLSGGTPAVFRAAEVVHPELNLLRTAEFFRPLPLEFFSLLALLFPQLRIHAGAAAPARYHLSHGRAVVDAAQKSLHIPDPFQPGGQSRTVQRRQQLQRVTKLFGRDTEFMTFL